MVSLVRITENCKVGGYDLPADSLGYVNLYCINRDPTIWPEPYKFSPEKNFLEFPDNDKCVERESVANMEPETCNCSSMDSQGVSEDQEASSPNEIPENDATNGKPRKRMKLVRSEYLIPFSLGKRECIGSKLARQDLFIIFVILLQHFSICPPHGQEECLLNDESCTINGQVLRFVPPFELSFIPRH